MALLTWVNPLPVDLTPTRETESFKDFAMGETGLPLNPHPGAFGVERRHHIHEGVDLYAPEETAVFAVEPGIVVAILAFTGEHADPPSPWWNNTWAIMVEGQSGVVLYGEIIPHKDVAVGQEIGARARLGSITRVLRHDKGRPCSMLHLELHEEGTRDAQEWRLGEPRPPSLRDPTPMLLQISGTIEEISP